MLRMLSKTRPRQVFYYSQKDEKILFDESELGPAISIPSWLGLCEDQRKWDLSKGLNKFTPYSIPKDVSTVKNLLLTMVEYEKQLKKDETKDATKEDDLSSLLQDLSIKSDSTILSHNGLFTDIVLKSKDVYNVIYYKGQCIFANTSRREDNNKFFAYIGLKFENLLKKDPSIPYNDHFKILLNGKINDSPYFTVAEIDGVTKDFKNDSSFDEKVKNYVEVKLCKTYNPPKFNASTSEMDKLKWMKANVGYFESKVEKYLFQSFFARQDTIVIGTRGDNSFVSTAFSVRMETLIEFVKNNYPTVYGKFTNRDQTLSSTLKKVIAYIEKNKGNEEKLNVFTFETKTGKIRKQDKESALASFNNSIIPEFIEWNDNKASV